MKGLKATRKELGYSRAFILANIGLAMSSISEIENGKNVPTYETRKKIESVLNKKINWLDVPYLKISPVVPMEWNFLERDYRSLVRGIKGLPIDERKPFIESAIRHLNDILTKLNK
jgi:transcriptional regulator with XRE-family HTH domain